MMFKIFMIIFGLVILVASPPLFVFMVAGLAPAFVASIVDHMPGKNTSATVLFFNLAGVAIYAMDIMHHSSKDFAAVLSPVKLMVVYLFAGCGWFFVWLLPRITVIISDYKNEKRGLEIKTRMDELTEEWGHDIKG